MPDWYPKNKTELNELLDYFLSKTLKIKLDKEKIHGLVVPHAGYQYSGEIAGKGFSLLKNKKINKAIIFGPSHYQAFRGIRALSNFETPLGKIKITSNNLPKTDYEHSVQNQIPFLQKLNPDIEILPIVVGEINLEEAEKIANQFIDEDAVFIFSTDLSHFLRYGEALKKDKETIDIITKLNKSKLNNIDACGFYPLLILFGICRLKNWKPKLIEYKNSGDITGDKTGVVGYSSFFF